MPYPALNWSMSTSGRRSERLRRKEIRSASLDHGRGSVRDCTSGRHAGMEAGSASTSDGNADFFADGLHAQNGAADRQRGRGGSRAPSHPARSLRYVRR
eukprot:3194484-Rhodomonas_salina.1